HRARSFCASTSALASNSDCRWLCSLAAASNARFSLFRRTRYSRSSLSSRAPKSWTTLLSRSKSASISVTPRLLFTIFPDLFEQFIELFDYRDRFVHPSKQFIHVTLLEFLALGVAPII